MIVVLCVYLCRGAYLPTGTYMDLCGPKLLLLGRVAVCAGQLGVFVLKGFRMAVG